jgi:hypothetical protein
MIFNMEKFWQISAGDSRAFSYALGEESVVREYFDNKNPCLNMREVKFIHITEQLSKDLIHLENQKRQLEEELREINLKITELESYK